LRVLIADDDGEMPHVRDTRAMELAQRIPTILFGALQTD
jgi:hypothetical protein